MPTPTWFGINAPFQLTGGGLIRQIDEVLVRADLLQLLLTAPGERVKRPRYGSPIPIFPFEDMSEESLSDLRQGILSAIDTYETRIIVSKLDIQDDSGNNLITITIYAALNIDRSRTFELNINIPKGQL